MKHCVSTGLPLTSRKGLIETPLHTLWDLLIQYVWLFYWVGRCKHPCIPVPYRTTCYETPLNFWRGHMFYYPVCEVFVHLLSTLFQYWPDWPDLKYCRQKSCKHLLRVEREFLWKIPWPFLTLRSTLSNECLSSYKSFIHLLFMYQSCRITTWWGPFGFAR